MYEGVTSSVNQAVIVYFLLLKAPALYLNKQAMHLLSYAISKINKKLSFLIEIALIV